MAMMTFLCEHCGNKFQDYANCIDKPCNLNGCTFPLKPILNMRIEGIEKEKETNKFIVDINQYPSEKDMELQIRKIQKWRKSDIKPRW